MSTPCAGSTVYTYVMRPNVTSCAPQLLRQVVESAEPEFRMVGAVALVAGIPNVGKSTLINAVREQHRDAGAKKKKSKGRVAGVGRQRLFAAATQCVCYSRQGWRAGRCYSSHLEHSGKCAGGGALLNIDVRFVATVGANGPQVSLDPAVFLVDSPGIMVPKVADTYAGLNLCLCCTLCLPT